MVDLGSVASGLYRVLGGIKTIMPLAKAIGGDTLTKIIGLVDSTIDVASNIKERVEDGTVVAGSNDLSEINDILSELQSENDKLAAYIAQS